MNRSVLEIAQDDRFKLTDNFLNDYSGKQPEWGPLGYCVYLRTYSRTQDDGTREEFWQTCQRVVEGVYTIQRAHCRRLHLPWSPQKAQRSAQEMYRLMWEMKFLPPGRGLWAMGTGMVYEKGGMCLFNCSFVSTKNLATSFTDPFVYMMDSSMMGVGTGFDVTGAGEVEIRKPSSDVSLVQEGIPDSREGWCSALRARLRGYTGSQAVEFSYSAIRKKGTPIKGFGGTSSGATPLRRLLDDDLPNILGRYIGKKLDATGITDVFNAIGRCVVAGNIRRSSQVALGPPTQEFLELKNPKGKRMKEWGWASNNSIVLNDGDNVTDECVNATMLNGEPGYFWLDNAKRYGRMGWGNDGRERDGSVAGLNPCQPGYATVLTTSGIRTIDDVGIGSTIWSGSSWTKIIDKAGRGIKDVFKYSTRAGVFIGTDNHKVVCHGKKVEVKDADTIDTSQGRVDVLGWVDPQDVLDGLVIGDGTCKNTRNVYKYVWLCVGKRDQDYFTGEVGDLIHEAVDSRGVTRKVSTTIQPTELPKTYKRRIPDRFFYDGESVIRGLLKGLYSANGTVISQRVTLKASSFALVEQVQVMLSSIGIRSYYTTNKAHEVEFSNGTYFCKESYDLNISTDRKLFKNLVGFIQEDKRSKLNEICESVEVSKYSGGTPKNSYEIISVESLGEEEVYDITVEDAEHTYWTGGLLVANCGEIALESSELCNVIETFPARHTTLEEYKRTLKFAYLYGKTVTLVPTHLPQTNAVIMRNRRIGMSMSGIVQAMNKFGRKVFLEEWCDKGYRYVKELDDLYSRWLCVPASIKLTTVKPAGTTSLLPGATPGIHFPHSQYYLRRIRFDKDSPLVVKLRDSGYHVEDDKVDSSAVVVSFPVEEEHFDKAKCDVSMWEQLELAAQMQHWWADNQVSVTVTFKQSEKNDIKNSLEMYSSRLKSVSFLPLSEHGYEQAPYEEITSAKYAEYTAEIKKFRLGKKVEVNTEHGGSGCDGDVCVV